MHKLYKYHNQYPNQNIKVLPGIDALYWFKVRWIYKYEDPGR